MAVIDDMNRLAAQDVVYLMMNLGPGTPPYELYRGRVRQALDGSWVFNASTGQNGVVGFDLGTVTDQWASSEIPAAGIQVTIPYNVYTSPPPSPPIPLVERITLMTVLPTHFTE